jgi:hypothetical protein
VSGPPRKQSFRLKSGHTVPEVIAIAKQLTQKNLFEIGDPEIANEIAELGYPGEEGMREALLIALSEITPEHYRAPGQPHKVPGIPFIWESKSFKIEMYLKFKLLGTKRKPVLWWYSCHPTTEYDR